MKLEIQHPLIRPAVEKMVIIWPDGEPAEPGWWTGSAWVDMNGYEKEVVQWAEFPKRTWVPPSVPLHLQPKPEHRLLIVGCSATKDQRRGEIPALQRYTGAYYQMIKGYAGEMPEIIILSAEYGFIRADKPIPDYDRIMDKARAAELLPGAGRSLSALLEEVNYDEVFVAAGQHYRTVIMPALRDLRGYGFKIGHTICVRGGIGEQRSQLKAWLEKPSFMADKAA